MAVPSQIHWISRGPENSQRAGVPLPGTVAAMLSHPGCHEMQEVEHSASLSLGAHTHRCDKDFSRKKLLPPPAPIFLSPVHTEYRLGIALAGKKEERADWTVLCTLLEAKRPPTHA